MYVLTCEFGKIWLGVFACMFVCLELTIIHKEQRR
jgi:hypothetical protein